MADIDTYFWPYVISQISGFLLLLSAIKTPSLARLLFFLLFGGACWVNLTTALYKPEVYLQYADMALPLYATFIKGWFREHTSLMVSLIAAGQGLIALGMLLKNGWVKFACTGTIVFLLAIAPLGVGAAFPFSITVSLAAYFILKKERLDYLWQFHKKI